jgi:hypothetical protein
VTLVRCKGDFPPCEEEWCTLGVKRFELHLQGVWFSGLKSQVVCLGSGRRSGRSNHDKSLSLNLSLPISLLLCSYLYSLHYIVSYIILNSQLSIIFIKRKSLPSTLFTPPLGLIIWATKLF